MKAEQMFNILNTQIRKGKNEPMVCNFLGTLSLLARAFQRPFRGPSYLLERVELTNPVFPQLGLRIAFSVCRPAQKRILNRKG